MSDDKPYGYFVWMKTAKGPPTPKKFLAELDQVYKATKDYYEQRTYEPRYPLSEHKWALSLDELALLYPAPVVKPTERTFKITPATD